MGYLALVLKDSHCESRTNSFWLISYLFGFLCVYNPPPPQNLLICIILLFLIFVLLFPLPTSSRVFLQSFLADFEHKYRILEALASVSSLSPFYPPPPPFWFYPKVFHISYRAQYSKIVCHFQANWRTNFCRLDIFCYFRLYLMWNLFNGIPFIVTSTIVRCKV